MRILIPLVVLAAAVICPAAGAASAPLRVCAAGCPYTSITGALSAAVDGDRIVVEDGAYSGALTIDKDVTIGGAGADATIVELGAGGFGSVVTVTAGADVTITGVTITGGSAVLGAGIRTDGDLTLKEVAVVANNGAGAGAAGTIFNGAGGVLTVLDSRVADNIVVDGIGGGIYNAGISLVRSSVIEGNGAEFVGAGIFNEVGATMDVVNTVVTHNFSALSGGGIANKGTLDVHGSRISDNTAQIFGGGLLNTGELTLTGTDVTTNTAAFGWGGGLYNEGSVALRGSSVTDNTAQVEGGGIYNLGTVELLGTNVSANTPDDCIGC